MGTQFRLTVNKIRDALKKHGIIPLSSVLIALCALFLTISQIDSTNRHNRLSVLPILQISYETDKNSSKIIIENVGTGPAIITSLEVAGDEANSIEPTIVKFQKANKLNFNNLETYFMKTAHRVVVQAGTSLTVVKLERNARQDEKANELILAGFLQEISLTACYRSVYGDRFHSTNNKESLKDTSCAYKDSYKIGKTWFRRQSLYEINQSDIFGY